MTWWTALYDDLLADLLLDGVDPAATAAAVDFLIATLDLRRGDRVFDQCSGTGRLAVPLAARGLEVVAVEQAVGYVERARRHARAAGVTVELVAGDAFAYVPDRPCRGAFNWWTGFGYLPDDAGNARMLRRAFEALAPGGRYALDFLNAPAVLRHLRPREVTTRDGVELIRDTWVDAAAGLMHKRWTFTAPDGRRIERPSTIRLYLPDQLAALIASVGFDEVRLLGSDAGEPLGSDSPRCIVVARRPGAAA